MPKGNGDVGRDSNVSSRCTGQEHGECRKAMETRLLVNLESVPSQHVRNTVNAERQWRRLGHWLGHRGLGCPSGTR